MSVAAAAVVVVFASFHFKSQQIVYFAHEGAKPLYTAGIQVQIFQVILLGSEFPDF